MTGLQSKPLRSSNKETAKGAEKGPVKDQK